MRQDSEQAQQGFVEVLSDSAFTSKAVPCIVTAAGAVELVRAGLAKWVVEGKSIELIPEEQSSTNDR